MKKLLIVFAFACVTLSSFAQAKEEDPTLKYSVATNSFWSNWYIQANFNWSAFYSSQEHGLGLTRNPFKSFRSSPQFSVAVGKWFTPGIGTRLKFYGIWGRTVNDEVKRPYTYWNLEQQVVFNMSNIWCGYNRTRVWNLSLFAGAGIDRSCDNAMYAMSYSAGLISQWRLCDRVSLNLEGGLLFKEHDSDCEHTQPGTEPHGWTYHEYHDVQFYAELGLTINLGRVGWNKTPDVDAIKALSQAQIDALNAQLADANAENARLKNLLANQKPAPAPEPQIVKEFVCPAISVFFNINRWNIASKKDLVNVKNMAEFAKENDLNLKVTGYADSATGTPAINQTLSEKRAKTVADELVKMGVSRDNIKTDWKGGVADLSPVSYNRRATVEIAK